MFGGRIQITVLGPVLALGLAAPAHADGVNVTSAGTISGPPVVGAKLTVSSGSWAGPSGTTIGRVWLRCDTGSTTNCPRIDGATSTAYTLTSSDKGKYLRVALYAVHGATGTMRSRTRRR